MVNFFNYFDTGLKIYIAGIVSYPVGKYLIARFGGALWEDAKKVAYSAWDMIKAKV